MALALKPCSVHGCNGNADGSASGRRGFCWKHYLVFRRENRHLLQTHTPSGEPQRWIEDHATFDGSECLIWPFARDPAGYGRLEWAGRVQVASRVMCKVAHGEPPTPSSETLHRCGNGSGGCAHPGHVRWGTSAENSADAIEHGTAVWGEKSGRAVLTAEQVQEIRALRGIESQRSIAKRFGVSHSCVGMIQRRVNWSRLT